MGRVKGSPEGRRTRELAVVQSNAEPEKSKATQIPYIGEKPTWYRSAGLGLRGAERQRRRGRIGGAEESGAAGPGSGGRQGELAPRSANGAGPGRAERRLSARRLVAAGGGLPCRPARRSGVGKTTR